MTQLTNTQNALGNLNRETLFMRDRDRESGGWPAEFDLSWAPTELLSQHRNEFIYDMPLFWRIADLKLVSILGSNLPIVEGFNFNFKFCRGA